MIISFEHMINLVASLSDARLPGDSYGNKKGSYGYTDAHGVYRKVDYIADEHGFRAKISTNEPGTDSADPANVSKS